MQEAECPVIIATKGYPCTGKSTLALILARILKCVLIDQDDVHDCIANLQQSESPPPDSGLPTYPLEEHLIDRSFEALCRIASKQLLLGMFKVIIDSPLSRQVHLQRLLQLSSSVGARLLIIECKPQDQYEWQLRLEQRGRDEGTSYSCKPSTWEDLEMLMERYNVKGCWDYETGDNVSKLVVNTTAYVRDWDLVQAVNQLSIYKNTHCVDFHVWVAEGLRALEEDESDERKELGESERERHQRILAAGGPSPYSHAHLLTLSNQQNDHDDSRGSCRGCLKPISGAFYGCSKCTLSLHKLCAELPDKKLLLPHQTPPFLDPTTQAYSFQGKHRCNFHADANMEYSEDCRDCAFETHLRCALVPTVLLHDCHQHPLFFMIFPVSYDGKFKCHGCGDLGKDAFYCCYECNLVLHVNCAMLPPTRKDVHHRHILTITSPPPDDSDEVYCDSCETRRNPSNWIYYCAKCNFAAHLYCK